jgi:hypothetical protein
MGIGIGIIGIGILAIIEIINWGFAGRVALDGGGDDDDDDDYDLDYYSGAMRAAHSQSAAGYSCHLPYLISYRALLCCLGIFASESGPRRGMCTARTVYLVRHCKLAFHIKIALVVMIA